MLRRLTALLLMLGLSLTASATSELPLAADQTLEFQIEEATWLSLDVAPDGTQMVIEVLGDLYLLPIAGGRAEPLSLGMHFDSQPRFSPDGEHIAFVSDRDGSEEIWLLELASGETRKLSTTTDRIEYASPAWAPDGRQVIASRLTFDVGAFELWAFPIDGGSGVQITKAKPKSDTPRGSRPNALGAVYDPSGRYLYYARKAGGFGYNLTFPLWQIARRDLLKGTESLITQAAGSAFKPAISPDGEYLVYGTRHEQQTGLRIRELSSGTDEWLAYPVQRDEQESRFTRDLLPGYAFTPDGQSLIFTKAGKLLQLALADKSLTEIPFSVDIKKDVAERLEFSYRAGLGPVKARILSDAQLSPDGRKIAFTAFAQVHVHDLVSGKTTAVSPDAMITAAPAWSPKGDALAFVSWTPEGGHIYRSKPRAKARPKQLTRAAAFYRAPAWSPDGERIVALRGSIQERLARLSSIGPPVGSDVIWLNARGGEVRLVMPSQGFGRPHFGPENDRIYLQTTYAPSPGKKRAGLVSVRFDGTDRRDILAVSGPGRFNNGEDVGAESLRIAPDGQHVLILHADQVYVARLLPYLPNQKVRLSKPQIPLAKLTDVGADYIGWNGSADRLYWTVGNRVYSRPLSSIEFMDADDDSAAAEENGEEDSDQDNNGTQALAEQDGESGGEQTSIDEAVDAPAQLLEQHEGVTQHEIDVYRPRHKAEGTVALTNAVILSMGPEGVVESGTVIIADDRIAALGPSESVEIPTDARVFDLQGRFLLPGFIDTHAHFRVARGVPGASNASFLANLAYGVTTGMDVQPSTVDMLTAQDMVDAGLMLGPRAYSTGPGIFSNNAFKSSAHAQAVLRRYKDFYRVNNIKAYISGSRKQRQWLIQAARELKLMPTTEGYLDMKVDITHAIDGFSGLEHNYPVPTLHEDVVQLTARTRIAYTPTLLVTYGGPAAESFYYASESPHDDAKLRRFTPYSALAARTLRRAWFHPREYVFQEVAASSKAIVDAGGQVGIGGHGQLQGLGYHWELWSVASGGYDNMQALKLATLMGAQMLGLDQDLGSIEVGKLADMVVLNEDPREDLRHTTSLEWVMKGGELYEADSLDQIWPVAKPLPPQWWWANGPESLPQQ